MSTALLKKTQDITPLRRSLQCMCLIVAICVISAGQGRENKAEKLAVASAEYPLAGFWKVEKCSDPWGLAIAPAGNGYYSVSFCGPGGCFEPGTYRPNTTIKDDPGYRVLDPDTIEVKSRNGFSRYVRCVSRESREPANRVALLALVTQPGGVQAYVDERFKGLTSEQKGTLEIEGLTPGKHQLRLTLPGYKEWTQEITLVAGELRSINAKLESAGPKPLGFEEVEGALKNGISNKRVGELVKQYGVDFSVNPEREQALRKAGADGELLYLITQSKK